MKIEKDQDEFLKWINEILKEYHCRDSHNYVYTDLNLKHVIQNRHNKNIWAEWIKVLVLYLKLTSATLPSN